MPDITIITAARLDTADKIRWLRDCAESILRQSFEGWEWVVVDDASPNKPDVPSDVRIRVVRAHAHSGTARCRNTAVGLARSPCVFPLDADDMLAGNDSLEALLNAWREHAQNSFVYGDLQEMKDGQPGRVIKFPPYDFVKSLNPKGIVPVCAAHSVECWHRAGGWKPQLEHGLEDVEYWISAGASGFCGVHLDRVTVLYRKHPQSRTQIMRAAMKERDMRQMIREMHPALHEGRLPMGCCGGGKSKSVGTPAPQVRGTVQPTRLTGPERPGGKIWVEYMGNAGAEFQVRGSTSGDYYKVQGPGHKFEAWAMDADFLARLGRGTHFRVGVSPPVQAAPEPEPEPEEVGEPEYQAPEPQLAVIERLDPVGAATREIVEPDFPPIPDELKKGPTEPEKGPVDPQMAGFVSVQRPSTGLAELDMDTEALRQEDQTPLDGMESLNDQMKAMLTAEGWSLEKLARADVEELIPYPGIGKVTAARAIAEANRLWTG